MLLDERVDALTAMGTSMALVWNNLPVMLAWGAIVLALFLLSLATGLLGLIVVFPLLGHGTWHAYATPMPAASDELLLASRELGAGPAADASSPCPAIHCGACIAADRARAGRSAAASSSARVNLSTRRVTRRLAWRGAAAAASRR